MRPLEIYIHIPFCQKKCRYCDFLSFCGDIYQERAYVQALLDEIRHYGELNKGRRVSTVFIGGGTPSWLHENYITNIMDVLTDNFSVDPEAEITIEVNPGTVTEAKVLAYKEAGINRVSIGLQSANEDELKTLGRIHNFDQFLRTFELFRKNGFYEINVDVMTGLPGQTKESLQNTLHQVLWLRPEHISCYSLIVEEGTPFFEEYWQDVAKRNHGKPTEFLPDEELEYELSELATKMLVDNGYKRYEISNYAREGFECEHNIGYWIRKDYLGLGLGAATLNNETRYNKVRNLDDYLSKVEAGDWQGLIENVEVLSRKSQMSEFMFLGLRMLQGVSIYDFQLAFQTDIFGIYGDVIRRLEAEELIKLSGGRLFLTKKGLDLGNYCMAEFLLE